LSGDLFEQVKAAQKLYYLAVKYQNRVPYSIITFTKKICNEYTKTAKRMNLSLTPEELAKYTLK
jgi:hypothetical protein